MTALPDAPWRNRTGLDRLTRTLGAADGHARFVGGAVRDTLLGIDVADVDVATVHAPERVMELLQAAGIRAVPTGIAHGTVTAVLPSGPVEVTTLRRDVDTDGRRATVAFTDDWRADAARRDFTMNALYADPLTGEIFDYFGGLDDLERRHVRFIGEPLQRIAEDHLRILRFFRFLARFGDVPDPEGLAACVARANDLMALSRERIADELLKLLIARDAVKTVALMVERGILAPVLPEITAAEVERLARTVAREQSLGLKPAACRRLGALLPRDAAVAQSVAARLKLSKADRKRLENAVQPPEQGARADAYRLGVEFAVDRLINSELSDEMVAHRVAAVRDWTPPTMPIRGGEIIRRGISAGPDVARLVQAVERQWIEEDFPGPDRVAAIADALVDQALRSNRKS
ncbi:CCA tRNA nucleotidyltransferase [Stakelama saccharophila]|uniref:CCA tRNA nucleotidyltransferase n=1 Tax=Stakelama saccharophila TaxID=3075605 RepID=A0ABZ0B6V1_9SPHN|nr:CCA tRNA nucleotidyltransferase [Stakelama sp. W311]WNO52967.1 CCA tRNA nucleotidyltransferase [Stakelama sp. W311]